MANEYLATYLNDHLAGASGALELLEHLADARAGTPMERFVAEIHAEVLADRQELEAIMEKLDIAESRSRKATGWLSEKAAQLKLLLDDRAGGDLHLLESLEAVEIGVAGKRALWRALEAASENVPELRVANYADLVQRAEDQHRRLEDARLEAARAAFGAA
jgi:hypothetical protein